jgi:photosystem II stability/assembly factor-like uncharacterized protein
MHRTELLLMAFCGLIAAVNPVFARTWTPTTPNGGIFWAPAASSADGTQLMIVDGVDELIYTSTNSGITWTQATNAPLQHWLSVASSADGTKLVAVADAATSWSIYTSTNAGTTWGAVTNAPKIFWYSIASSADGTKLVALAMTNLVYTSTDSGNTWTSNSVPIYTNQWLLVASSADGNKLVIVGDLGPVFTSTNSGTTWTAETNVPGVNWQAVTCSADGSKLLLVGLTNLIYISSDWGVTWQSNSVPGIISWQTVASSTDGSKLVAEASINGPIYTSTNSGATWSTETNTYNNYYLGLSVPVPGGSIVSSADGSKFVMTSTIVYTGPMWTMWGDDIFITYSPPSPQLNITSSTGNVWLSWIVPSTNFVLQQNLDLTTANWVTLTDTPTLNLTNLQNEVMLSPSNNSGFYRLATP